MIIEAIYFNELQTRFLCENLEKQKSFLHLVCFPILIFKKSQFWAHILYRLQPSVPPRLQVLQCASGAAVTVPPSFLSGQANPCCAECADSGVRGVSWLWKKLSWLIRVSHYLWKQEWKLIHVQVTRPEACWGCVIPPVPNPVSPFSLSLPFHQFIQQEQLGMQQLMLALLLLQYMCAFIFKNEKLRNL